MADKATQEALETVISDDILKAWISEAEEGSETHQLQLGLYFLKLAELNIEKEINAEKSVAWFIAASRQGNESSTQKLRHCVETNTGITDKNKSDVTWCLKTSVSEKKIRHAARSLFSKINRAHKGALSIEEYKDAINSLAASNDRERKLLLAAGRKIGSTISENDFVKILSRKIQGTLTLTANEMDETTAAYDSAGIIKKVFVYPRQTATIAFDRALEYASKEGLSLVLSLIPTNQIYLLAVLFAYSYLTPHFFLLVVPLMVFYISLLVMVISTLQMFYKRRKQKDATTLAAMLQEKFDMDIDMNSAQSQYSWNSKTPYVVFFLTLPIFVMSFSLGNKTYIPCSELFVVSFVMTGVSFFGLSDSFDFLTLVALGSHAFALLPVFCSSVPNFPVISEVLIFIVHPFVTLNLGVGVSFNISVPAIIHMLVPFLLLCMAMRGSWSGIYKILIPHLVCYFWFNVFTTLFPFTTWVGLARATLGYILLPVIVPFSLILVICGVIYSFYYLIKTEVVGKLLVTALLLAVPILLSQTKTFFGQKVEKSSLKAQKMKKILMIIFAVLGTLPLMFLRVPTLAEKKSFNLRWEDYKDLCLLQDGIMAPYQLRCRDFLGTKVHWKGVLEQVKIIKVENTAESVITALPSILAEPLSCIYGERIPECDETSMSTRAFIHCQLVETMGRTCHLRNHNQLTFSLLVKVEDFSLNLEAGSTYQTKVLALLPGDEIEFLGILTDVGTLNPGLKLKSINCTQRELPAMAEVEVGMNENDILKNFNDAFALTFNFALFPIFKYSPE